MRHDPEHTLLGRIETAGERVEIACSIPWVSNLILEGAAEELTRAGHGRPSVRIRVERERAPFETKDWLLLTRGAWSRNGEVILENVCTSGFDVHVDCSPAVATFTYRWRPPTRDRVAAHVLRSRFHLLARCVLIQYPVLWWAGVNGRIPIHASACTTDGPTILLTGASGVGRSTLLHREVQAGGRTTGDNIAVTDGATAWGLAEPMRVDGGEGRRMPHGRNETRLPDRAGSLVPDAILVLRRGSSHEPEIRRCSAEEATRDLVTSTYMAGELRRYWGFAATLAAGTARGGAHPPIVETASALADALPCSVLAFSRTPRLALSRMLAPESELTGRA